MAPSRPCISGLPGTHGDAPEAELHPRRNERLLDEVVIANRGAAERHQDVGFGVMGAADRRFHARRLHPTAMPRSTATPP